MTGGQPEDIPVFYETFEIGRMRRDEAGPSFSYSNAWRVTPQAFPISLTMPFEQASFGPEVLLSWLQNLLPEGDPLRVIGRITGISRDDILALALRIGRDTAGALSIGQPREGERPGYVPVPDDAALGRIIAELPSKPFLVGEEGVSMSLAGVQEKLPVTVLDGRISIPRDGAASTHILKPDARELPGSVWNEALCMVLARRVGLSAAPVTTGRIGERAYLLVERYDRIREDGVVRRIHQEDFCQALGRAAGEKYENNQTGRKGPGIVDFFGLARRLAPGQVSPLLDAVAFNILVGNVDSHAKNYSILFPFNALERPRLAPLYDLMSGPAWERVTQNHAQAIGGERNGRQVQGKHWQRMAQSAGIGPSLTLRRVRSLAENIEHELASAVAEVDAMSAGGYPLLDLFAEKIRERTRTVRTNLDRREN